MPTETLPATSAPLALPDDRRAGPVGDGLDATAMMTWWLGPVAGPLTVLCDELARRGYSVDEAATLLAFWYTPVSPDCRDHSPSAHETEEPDA